MQENGYPKLRLVALGLIASVLFGCTSERSSRIDDVEQQRRKAFDHHATVSESARAAFDRQYNKLVAARTLSLADIAAALGTGETPVLKRTAGGEYEETTFRVPTSYSRVIVSWDASGNADGYAWETVSPAASNVSWARHTAKQANKPAGR